MKKRRFETVVAALTAFLGACAVWRPQLPAMVWRALADVAAPLLWGGALALVLYGPYRRLSLLWGNTAWGRTAALLVCYLTLGGIGCGAVLLLAPQLAQSVLALSAHSAEYADNLRRLLTRLENRLSLPQALRQAQQQLLQNSFAWVVAWLQGLLPQLVSWTAQAAKVLMQMVLGLFFSIYMLTDGPALTAQAKTALRVWLPKEKAHRILRFIVLCRRMVYGWLCGQLLDSLILGAACGVGMALLRLPFAALVGLICGVCNIIPLIGGMMGGALGVLLLASVQPLQAVWFVVYYLILQQLEGRFLYPRIVASRLGLPPLLVLLAVLCGSEIGGLVGIVLALPAAAVVWAAARSATRVRRIAAHTHNKESGEM